MENFDLVVVGGGIIGVAALRSCLKRHPGLKACLVECEPELAAHQSSRNSGVVHVGYNQKPGTIKAKFVVEGSRRLRQFCREHKVPLVEDGILVVARDESEVQVLDELHKRGLANGAVVELINQDRLLQMEPHASGVAALSAPEGASFDPRAVVLALADDARALGAQFYLSEQVIGLAEDTNTVRIETTKRTFTTKILVCAAGLYADRLAHKVGLGKRYQMVPFRGEYHELVPERRSLVRSHIYPAPNLKFPFLGVHLSRTFDGRVLVGPGAVLAMGRESYKNTQVNFGDLLEMAGSPSFWKLFASADFREVAQKEWKKSLFASEVLKEAQQLLPELRTGDLVPSRAGIRAQLVSDSGQLVEDLTIEESALTIQVLNAVSPALTCSLPFADHIVDLIEKRL